MSQSQQRKNPSVLRNPPLLKSESLDEFHAFRKAFEAEIKPRGAIEKMYVEEFVKICWDIQRLRPCKASIINTAFRPALEHLLKQLLGETNGSFDDIADDLEGLSVLYFTSEEAKTAVSKILARFQLKEFAIEAQAIRNSLSDLELIERMLASLEVRRDRTLACIADYRETFAQKVRESAGRMVEGKDLLRLENQRDGKPAAA
jgi:hypothetical protein